MAVKHIFVTGGVVSGLGKGITAASLGRLLIARGYKVTMQKLDPYINVDPGTMSPYQHGEVFVTEDGAETDLDLGHYERFTDTELFQYSNVTAGKVYWSVISKERRGDYLGGTVQVIPHITNEIKNNIYNAANYCNCDVVITEVGGTVGDIESLPFIEAIRQVVTDVGRENCMYIHVTLVPYLSKAGEQKSKPTQHSVKELLGLGIQPDVIVCRSEIPLTKDMRDKIALFCNIKSDCVIENLDAHSIYEVPLMIEKQNLADIACQRLQLEKREPDLTQWNLMIEKMKSLSGTVRIALVGKYVALHDAYISVAESLKHAGFENKVNVEIKWIDSEYLTRAKTTSMLSDVQGILVPGGFGDRGIEGKIEAIRYAREHNIPFFGICLGMQLAVVEFARNILGFSDANSTELNEKTTHPVIHLMEDQVNIEDKGGTMRLGKFPCVLKENSKSFEAYKEIDISERHRHRYEFNNRYRDEFEKNGMKITGKSPNDQFVEIIEMPSMKWFVGVQFHPEFKSRPTKAHPLFREFIKNAKLQKKQTD